MKKIFLILSLMAVSTFAGDPTFKAAEVTKTLNDSGEVVAVLVIVECTKDGVTRQAKGYLTAQELSDLKNDEAGTIKKVSERLSSEAQKAVERDSPKEQKYSQQQLDAVSIDPVEVAKIHDAK